MLGPKVPQHPLEPLRFAPRTDLHALGKGSQIALRRLAPESFRDGDGSENAPPAQGFFFLTEAPGWAA